MPVIIDGTNGITQAGEFNSDSSFGFKNRIINGAMVIDQRNAGASVTAADNVYTLDRWQTGSSASSKFTIQQNAGSVTPPAGFSNYLGCTSSSAYTVGAGETFNVAQQIEGYNSVADLAWGTANAKTVTLSFWVRSSLTGTFGGALANSNVTRSYPFSYTILAANTWEQKTITIAGDTSGTWQTTNSTGIRVWMSIGTGATLSGTAGAWAGSDFRSVTGATSVVGTSGATFYITGVQLEVGSTATSFDYRPFGTELMLCQRYFQKTNVLGVGTTPSSTQIYMVSSFVVTMRSAPTASVAGTTWSLTDGYAADETASSPTIVATDVASTNSIRVQLGGFASFTAGRVYFWRPVSTSLIGLSAEL
jgi:hypothetical protein